MSTRSAEPESRDNSPDREGSPGKRPSKKRKVLSCYACRNRKMKCDRVYPVCGRCQKTGRSNQCTYDPRLLEDLIGNNGAHSDGHNAGFTIPEDEDYPNTSNATSLNALQWKAKAQERRIQELERTLAAKESNKNPSHYYAVPPQEMDNKEQMMFRGKGFKTSFSGATSLMSMIAQYREMQAFTREALITDHSIKRIRIDFKTFRDRRKTMTKKMGLKTHGKSEEVFAAVPERHLLDVQVALYFQTCETAYRILHEPSFWREYHAYWERQADDYSQAGFAVILVLISAITKCLDPKDDVFDGDTTADRQAASNMVDICDAWINQQPRKRLTLQFFQFQCLCLFAKRVNCVKLKQDWITSGDVIRLAIASGMHRDPTLLSTGRISVFEKEMKKRLWVTIMELELQSSIEFGLQSSLASLYWDTPSPANLPDDAFSADTLELPASRPSEHFTSVSYLRVAVQSLPLRIHLAQLLNDPSEKIRYEDVLQYDAQIHELLAKIPSWDDLSAVLPSALLQLQLRQYLLILHTPYARAAYTNSRYMHSFVQCVDVASKIAVTHDDLVSKRILALNNIRNDAVRVCLALSQIVYHNCAKSGPVELSAPASTSNAQIADSQTHFADLRTKGWAVDIPVYLAHLPREPFLARTLCISAIEAIHLAVQVFEQKVMRLGTAYMEYWLICAAVGMLPPSPNSKPPATSIAHIMATDDDIRSRCRKTLDRFQTLAFRVLALQKDSDNALATSLRTTMASVSPSDIRTPSVRTGTGGTGTGFGATPSAGDDGTYIAISGMDMGVGIELGAKDMNGTFDNLQDMQMDLGGWNFPDFWAFDLGGEFS